MTLAVHLLQPPTPEELAELQPQLHPTIQLTSGPQVPADCHVLVASRPQRAHLEAGAQLREVIVPFTGVPEDTQRLMADFPHIALHNSHHPAAPTAEMALALLFAAARRLIPADRALRAGDWTAREAAADAALLEGKTVLILGYGQIGQRVAKVCHALGMRVLALRRNVAAAPATEIPITLYALSDLAHVLPQAEALVVALPLTAETRGLLGATELALLPRGALLVNVGRGPIVDEQALYEALRAGGLGAAGLDVWYTYPADETARTHTFPSTFPFHELDNVVLSPHRGGLTQESAQGGMAQLASMLNAAARGEPMPNRVDVRAGY